MSLLSTFQSDLNAVVVGASGGIGAAFVRSIGNSATQANIRSFSRSGRSEDSPKGEHIDITDERSVAQAAEKAASAGPFDLVLVATGLLHDGDIRPEKTMRELSPDAIATAFAMAVTYPSAGNIGGGGFMIYHGADGDATAFDFREKAPLSSTKTMYLDENGDVRNNSNHASILAICVPGTVACLELSH